MTSQPQLVTCLQCLAANLKIGRLVSRWPCTSYSQLPSSLSVARVLANLLSRRANGRKCLCLPQKSVGWVTPSAGTPVSCGRNDERSGLYDLVCLYVHCTCFGETKASLRRIKYRQDPESRNIVGQAHSRDLQRAELGCSSVEK